MGCKLFDKKKFMNEEEDLKKVEFLCPECGEISPEISNFYIDQKYVEFKCKICAEKVYFSEFFYNKKSEDGKLLSFSCKPKPSSSNQQDEKFLFKESIIKPEEKEESKKSSSKGPSKNDIKKYKEIIKQKNEQLKKIILFNNIILRANEQCQDNYFHLKSLQNLSKTLTNEKERDSNDLKFLLAAFNYEIKISKDAIKKINDFLDNDEKIENKREEESLLLIGKNLNDEYIKYISKIKFNQLKEINLSGNEIINIEPLCMMNLPFLEFLNLSNNQIENINPLKEINSKNFNFLFIQHNQITDIQLFLDDDFPTFEILRIDNNNIDENSKKKLIDLYKKKNLILIINIDDIKKYSIDYKEDMTEIKVENQEEGDLMLKYIFINIPSNNIIKKLKLINNKIEDPSILNRIQFEYLEELDLSLNNIASLNFLKGMKAKNLKELYLEKNKFDDLSALYNIKVSFKYLDKIYLEKDKFNPDEPELKYLKDTLKNNKVELIFI